MHMQNFVNKTTPMLYKWCYQSKIFGISYTQHCMQWIPVIGLEIHAQINSSSKLFSGAPNKFMSPPNSTVANFDASIPGTLPVLNHSCVEMAVKTAFALNCQVNKQSSFDRKHYFYSDMPQGYQITQYRNPIAKSGYLCYPSLNGIEIKRVNIEQVQLEQDSGKSLHDDKITFVDLNRAGVGLMEIVTKPDLSSADDCAAFSRELCFVLKRLGTCGGKHAQGQYRVDVNISLKHPDGSLGTRAEVKNISGLDAIRQVVEFEIKRQKNILESGGVVKQETRAYDEILGETVPMRDKEVQQDYRFMPEPNLPILRLLDDQTVLTAQGEKNVVNIDEIKRKMPISLTEVRKIIMEGHKLSFAQAQVLIDKNFQDYYLQIMSFSPSLDPKLPYDWLRIKYLTIMQEYGLNSIEDSGVLPDQFAALLLLEQNLNINRTTSVKAFKEAIKLKKSPVQIIEENDWKMISDEAIVALFCKEAIEALKDDELVSKYNAKKPKSNKNKGAVTRIIDHVVDSSNNKIHTKIAKKIILELLSHQK